MWVKKSFPIPKSGSPMYILLEVWRSVPFTFWACELLFVSDVGRVGELLSHLPGLLSVLVIDSFSVLWLSLGEIELTDPLLFGKIGYKTVYRNWLQNYCFFYRKILNKWFTFFNSYGYCFFVSQFSTIFSRNVCILFVFSNM